MESLPYILIIPRPTLKLSNNGAASRLQHSTYCSLHVEVTFFRTSNAKVTVNADIVNGALVQREFEAAHDMSDG